MTATDVTIRKARFSDRYSVQKLFLGSMNQQLNRLVQRSKLAPLFYLGISILWWVNDAMDTLGSLVVGSSKYVSYSSVAIVRGKVIGSCLVKTLLGSSGTWFLGPVAVDAVYSGKGIGSLLVKNCLDHIKAQGGKRVFLTVNRDNESAIAVYTKCGFKETDSTKVMECVL